MNSALIIARREVAEKKFVFVTAIVGAILPFLTTLLPTVRNWSPQGIVSMSASILAVGLALGLAIIGGASMIGRELSERRLSFYFARPVGAASIWFGKLAAALFVLFAAPAIVLTPAMLFAGDQWRTFGGGQWQMIGAMALLSVQLLCASHLVSTFVRSRSLLVIVDFVLAAAAGLAIPMMVRPLWNGMATHTISGLFWALAIAFLLAVIIGGAWQVADGRTDRKRSHAALSRAFWSVMAVALLASGAFVAWTVSAKPSDVGVLVVQPARAGNWVLLNGIAPHRGDYLSSFVFDLSSGRYVRVSGNDVLWRGASFTLDGKTAVLRQRIEETRSSQSELVLISLEDGKRHETGLLTGWDSALVVSDDAKRAAYLENNILTVYDVPSKRSLASVRTTLHGPVAMFFASPNVVRLYDRNDTRTEVAIGIHELDVNARAIRQTGELRTEASGGLLSVSADGSKMMYRAFSKGDTAPESLILADARTGARIATVPRVEGFRVSGAALLADGSMFVPTVRDGQITARFFGSNGALVREIPLGRGERAFVAAQLPGNRLVAGTTFDKPMDLPTISVVDVSTGQILRRTSIGIYPSNGNRDPRLGAPSERLLAGLTRDALVAWDPLTGATKEVARRATDAPSISELMEKH